ncbi:MAG: copper uptake system-associated protein [Azonexus sp.]|jgi:hypothetical protein|nr:copper uptake system-associated protein [Azonexus sp.]
MHNCRIMVAGCLIGMLFLSPLVHGGESATGKEAVRTQQRGAAKAIERYLKHQFHKPDAPLAVLAVASDGNYGIASWAQDDRAGRALLKKDGGQWSIVVCAGDALIDIDSLVLAGLARPTAKRLAGSLVRAESGLSAQLRQKIAAFAPPEDNPHAGHAH